ncbi:MAG: hypothetical protein APR63_11160 [Desulfuromonas sp. SDB]|nr:MAG: hypothetical protein APR63_11160 [Desulfuromonas sp. SDB]
MNRKLWDIILMTFTGICFLVNIIIINIIPPRIKILVIVGYVILGLGILLFFISLLTLLKNKPGQLIKTGIYRLVRHPMYLGAIIMFSSHIFFGQHWIVFLSTSAGIICCYLIMISGDQRNLIKFGDDYKNYMKSVPRSNILLGIFKLVKS